MGDTTPQNNTLPPGLLRAPFPYFGGKSVIAAQVWRWLGDVSKYIEPFFGSGPVLLQRPGYDARRHTETVNDADGLLCNFWRAVSADADAVARYADWPVNENDLHARHMWLVGQKDALQTRLEGDPYYYDSQIAGWWVWGICCWVGAEWCSGKGPWHVVEHQLLRLPTGEQGIKRRIVHITKSGQGIHGMKRPGLGEWFRAIQERLRRVRVCCGDWQRVCRYTPTPHNGRVGVFLDPPYAHTLRDPALYRVESNISMHVQQWCIDRGNNPMVRIVLSGLNSEHDVLLAHHWRKWTWNVNKGYGFQGKRPNRPTRALHACWISPHCLGEVENLSLFRPIIGGST